MKKIFKILFKLSIPIYLIDHWLGTLPIIFIEKILNTFNKITDEISYYKRILFLHIP
jgi:hypothetical protein